MKADETVIDEMEELLSNLKVVRENLDRGDTGEAKDLLEVAGRKLAALINTCSE